MFAVQECFNCERPFTNSDYGEYCSDACKVEFEEYLAIGAAESSAMGLVNSEEKIPLDTVARVLNSFQLKMPNRS